MQLRKIEVTNTNTIVILRKTRRFLLLFNWWHNHNNTSLRFLQLFFEKTTKICKEGDELSEIERAILLMRKNKITQREVAVETGYTEDWISMIFREKAKSDTAVEKILKAIDSIIAKRKLPN